MSGLKTGPKAVGLLEPSLSGFGAAARVRMFLKTNVTASKLGDCTVELAQIVGSASRTPKRIFVGRYLYNFDTPLAAFANDIVLDAEADAEVSSLGATRYAVSIQGRPESVMFVLDSARDLDEAIENPNASVTVTLSAKSLDLLARVAAKGVYGGTIEEAASRLLDAMLDPETHLLATTERRMK